jgi:sulfonate transport system ATP-binding protein
MIRNKPKELRVINLTKWFGSLHVLDNISFNLNADEICGVVGPTGCGKTTLLNIISGIIPATSGEVYLGDEKINPKKHKIAYIFQEESVFPFKTVRENIEFGLKIRGIPIGERKKIVDEIIDMLNLRDYEYFLPKNLSAALKQLVVLGRAIAINPDIILMDEPYGHLDAKTRRNFEDFIVELKKKYGFPLLFVTHDIEEAVYVCDRIFVLTQKPARIKQEIKVELPRPRDLTDKRFTNIVNQIIELIRWW